MTATNRRVVLRTRPEGMPALNDFEAETVDVEPLAPDMVLVRVDTISIDAFIRTTLEEGGYHERSQLKSPVVALGVGEVVDSTFDGLSKGDWVTGPTMAQTVAAMPGAAFQKIDVGDNVPPSTYLGVLGLTTGITSWVGLCEVGGVRDGDTVVVSGAAGAVGTVAVQLAKARGATVIGIAGGSEKCNFLVDDLGLHGAIDYKNDDIAEPLKTLAPDGVDLFFDNVGGEILDIVLDNLAVEGRVVICGAISQYQNMGEVRGPSLYLRLAERNASMRGFTVDHYPQQFAAAAEELTGLMRDGRMKLPEQVVEGVDRFPEALISLFSGGNTGKMLVKP